MYIPDKKFRHVDDAGKFNERMLHIGMVVMSLASEPSAYTWCKCAALVGAQPEEAMNAMTFFVLRNIDN